MLAQSALKVQTFSCTFALHSVSILYHGHTTHHDSEWREINVFNRVSITQVSTYSLTYCVPVWLSSNTLVSINVVALLQGRLVREWVTVF